MIGPKKRREREIAAIQLGENAASHSQGVTYLLRAYQARVEELELQIQAWEQEEFDREIELEESEN
jgi:hypothetical protein